MTLTLTAIAFGVALPAAANRGTEAEPAAPVQYQGDALACYTRAQDETLLSENQALTLCAGSSSPGPIDCYMRGDQETLLSDQLLITLCRCATSTEPVSCYERGEQETTVSDRYLVQMCSAIATNNLYSSCIPITELR